MYDFLIVGGGAAGCSIAYFLSLNGKKVALIDEGEICSKASGAAGAFINPTMGKPSNLKALSDEAYLFSVKYFKKHFNDIFWQCGTYLLPKNEKNIEEFLALQQYILFDCEYVEPSSLTFLRSEVAKFGAYFAKDAGIVEPREFCYRLLRDVDFFENFKLSSINYENGCYKAGNLEAKSIILSTGASKELLSEEYLKSAIVGLWGQKIEVECDNTNRSNISSEALISANKSGLTAIGATYVRSEKELEIGDEESRGLIDTARTIMDLDVKRIARQKGGLRATSIDHFPIVGQIIDSQASIAQFPVLLNGLKIANDRLSHHDNLYIFTGHTSKAFSVAFYCAKLFSDSLLGSAALPSSINSNRLFFRWCRRKK